MLGLLVGGGFFLFKLDDYFKELSFYKHLTLYSSDDSTRTNEDEKARHSSAATVKKTNYAAATPSKRDSSNKQPTQRAAALSFGADSLGSGANQNETTGQGDADDIVVRKDELISSRPIEIINLSNSTNLTRDSILQQISDIRDDKSNIARQAITLELWKSPINYKGYKMTRNKIVLFGISEYEDFHCYKNGEAYYLLMQQGLFKLEFTDDFHQFERVADQSLIARMKLK